MAGNRIQITKTSVGVTQKTNVANVFSDILQVKTPERLRRALVNNTVITMKLKDNTGTEIAGTSEIAIGVLAPGKTLPREVAKFIYDPWLQLTLAEQSDRNNQDRLRISMPWPGVWIPEQYILVIQAKADRVIDWTQSSILFELEEYRIAY